MAIFKTIRVFISSTFRDMQAERDWLVRFVFPKLRQELLKRRIHLVDVDLRWGVTSEQDALSVCREVVDECRPRFLCVLGGRYGWVPPGKDHSITADEVYYGVLDRNLTNRGFAYFYFRDPSATAAMVEVVPGEFREPAGSDGATALSDLKTAIVEAGLQPFIYRAQWDYQSRRLIGLKMFGDQVYADLTQSVDQEFGLATVEKPDEFSEEKAAMEAFIEERVQRFVLGSREQLWNELRQHAESADGNGYLCLKGAAGTGKSALLGKFCENYRAAHPQDLVIPHFVGASPSSTDVRGTLRRLCHELVTGGALTAEIPEDPEKLRVAFPEILQQAAAKKRVVVVLDAINQFDPTTQLAGWSWLPEELPVTARIILSSLVEEAEAVAGYHSAVSPLQTLRHRRNPPKEFELTPLNEEDAEAIIQEFLHRYRKSMTSDQRAALLAKTDADTPLYLLVALEELRTLGIHEEITDRIARLPPDTRELYIWILRRLEDDYGFRDASGQKIGQTIVPQFVSLLGASRHGLSQQELVELLSPGDPQGNIAALTQLLRPHLMQRGVLLDFFHSQFRAAVEAAYLPTPTSRLAVHRRLADYFEARELNLRRLEELPWQLKTAGERDRLIRCLSEPDVFLALYTAEFQYELLHYWNWLGSGADPAGVYGRAVAQFRKIAPTPSRFCAFTHQVARFLAWMGLSGAAEEHYRAALGLAEAIYGPNAAMTGAVQNNLAELLTGTGRTDEAGSLYQSSLQAAESNPDAPKVLGIALSNLGHWYHANGRFPEAEPLIRRALSIHEELKGPDCQEATVDRLNLAEVLVKCQRFEEAERCCRRALDSFLARHGSAHPETARCQQCLGLILQYTGRRAEAQRVYLEALATYEAAGIADWPEAVAVRNNVSWLLMEDSRTPRHVSPQAASHELDLRTDVE